MAHPVLKTLTVFVATAVAATTLAQGVPTPAEMPAYDPSVVDLTAPPSTGEPVPAPMGAEPIVLPDNGDYAPLSAIPMRHSDALLLEPHCPAITESSGTWLRRGLWYADVDAVIMARTWNDTGVVMIQEFDAVLDQALINVGVVNVPSAVSVQRFTIGESSPGYDGSARLALGRFLFRDQANRDHTFDMTVFGGAEWNERVGAEAQLNGVDSNGFPEGLGNQPVGGDQRGLHVARGIDSSIPLDNDTINGFVSFDRAAAMDIEYASRFHSWEWNYNVAQRMRKDRMELLPSGQWVRRASPGFSWNYLAGLRYFDVEERLDWTANDIRIDNTIDPTDADIDGVYNIRSSNNLFGLQLGAGLTYETDRWNITVSTKHGFYINDARSTEDLSFVDPDGDPSVALNDYTTDLHENGVSYLTQGSVMARYHLRPNLSLRAGWEFMYVTGLALAPNQANFNPATAQLRMSGDVFYHGVSFGTEYYW